MNFFPQNLSGLFEDIYKIKKKKKIDIKLINRKEKGNWTFWDGCDWFNHKDLVDTSVRNDESLIKMTHHATNDSSKIK